MVRTRAVVVAILAAASLGGWWLGRADRGGTQSAFVTRAVDGDTIDVRIGTHTDTVRLLGVAGWHTRRAWIDCAPALCREIEPSRWMTLVPAVHRGRYEVRAGPTHA